jgi:hypothetical protein
MLSTVNPKKSIRFGIKPARLFENPKPEGVLPLLPGMSDRPSSGANPLAHFQNKLLLKKDRAIGLILVGANLIYIGFWFGVSASLEDKFSLLFALGGCFMVGLGIEFFRGKRWARWAGLVMAQLGMIKCVLSMIQMFQMVHHPFLNIHLFTSLLIQTFLLFTICCGLNYYLLSPSVREQFEQTPSNSP